MLAITLLGVSLPGREILIVAAVVLVLAAAGWFLTRRRRKGGPIDDRVGRDGSDNRP